jgi:hypothetical protein
MARINKVTKARKSETERQCYKCEVEIKEGETYYWIQNRVGNSSARKNFCENHPPRPSDITTSDKLAALYAARESVEDAMARTDRDTKRIPFDNYKSGVASALDEAGSEARSVGEQYRESFDNLPENFQSSSDLEEKADSCDSWADTLDDAAAEIEGIEPEAPEKKNEDGSEDLSAYDEVDATAQEALDALEL